MSEPRWLSKTIERIKQLAQAGKVQFTHKALREMVALELGLDETDVCTILTELEAADFKQRVRSSITGETLYVFAPEIDKVPVYLKIAVRQSCVVISFHEDIKNED